jgi:hypothetical protein
MSLFKKKLEEIRKLCYHTPPSIFFENMCEELMDIVKNLNITKESQMKFLKEQFINYKKGGGNDPDLLDGFNLLFTDGFEV